MPLYVDDAIPRRTGPAFSEFPAPFGDVIRAQVADAWHWSPSPSIMRYNAMEHAEGRRMRSAGKAFVREQTQVDRLDAESARARVQQEGLDLKIPDGGIAAPALDLLIDMKREELRRQLVLGRAQGGVGEGAARLGAAFGISLFDPLNIALAFTPVVGEMRTAALLARAGGGFAARAGVRAGVGAVEGVAGAALVEPFIYSQAQREQADYSMADSLYNIAFGGLFGGGLHVVGGAVADRFRRAALPGILPPAEPARVAPDVPTVPGAPRETVASREQIDAALREMPVDRLDPLVREAVAALDARRMPEAPFARIADITPERARELALRELQPELRATLLAEAGQRANKGDIANIRKERTTLEQQVAQLESEQAFKDEAKLLQKTEKKSRKQAESAARKRLAERRDEAQARIAALDTQLEANAAATRAEQAAAALEKGQVPERFEAQVAARAVGIQGRASILNALDLAPEGSARLLIERADPVVRRDTLRAAVVQAVEGRNTEVDAIIRQSPASEQASAAVRAQGPDAIRAAEPEAPARVEQEVKEAGEMEGVESAQAEVERMAAMLDEESAKAPEIVAATAAVQRATKLRRAFEAAAACGIG